MIDAAGRELSVVTGRAVKKFEKLAAGFVRGVERFPRGAVLFIRKIPGKGRSGPADAEPPAFEGGGFVRKTGDVFLRRKHDVVRNK